MTIQFQSPVGRQKRKQKLIQKKQQRERRLRFLHHLKPVLWAFLVWFVVIGIIHLPFLNYAIMKFFVDFTTGSALWMGTVLGIPVESPGSPLLRVNGFSMQVVMECTAYNFYLFAVVLTIFARWPMRQKFISLGIFIAGIFFINNLRFISMGYLGSYRPDLFNLIHDVVWNVLFGFLIFGLWVWRELSAQRLSGNIRSNKPVSGTP